MPFKGGTMRPGKKRRASKTEVLNAAKNSKKQKTTGMSPYAPYFMAAGAWK
jgi:hypothetical protein